MQHHVPCQTFNITLVKHGLPVDTRPSTVNMELEHRLADFSCLQICFEDGWSAFVLEEGIPDHVDPLFLTSHRSRNDAWPA
jgi:hypothetical protein